MNELSWDLFRVKNSHQTKSYEALCKHLFARKINVKVSDFTEYHNQKGIEVDPIPYKGNLVSFQSKFSSKDEVLWSDFRESLDKTIEELPNNYKGLKSIFYYTNGKPSKDNKRRDQIEKDAKKNGICITWIYGKQILELLEENNYTDLKRKYFGGGQNLDIVTTEIEVKPKKNLSALKYQSQLTTFKGRAKELKLLLSFINDDDQIKWWLIKGKGGVGKSRLALHLSQILKKEGWLCGFFSSYQEDKFDSWSPEKPHLIICDYVIGREDEIGKAIYKAIKLKKNSNLPFKVRFLLIERNGNREISNLINQPTIGVSLENHYFKFNEIDKPLVLDYLKEPELHFILKEVATFYGLNEKVYKEVIAKLKTSKEPNNFIYGALLCLHKYYQLSNFPEIEFEDVIRTIIIREKKFWIDKLEFKKEEENYLIMASLVGGLNIKNLTPTKLLQNSESLNLKKRYGEIVGLKVSNYLPTLSHDLVNELYVLDSLENRDFFNSILKNALQYEQGKHLVSFFTRAANDYERHPSLSFLMTPFSNAGLPSLIWISIIANTIDKIDVEIDAKITLFQRLIHDLYKYAQGLIKPYTPFLDNIFLRILNECSSDDNLEKWILEYKLLYLKPEEVSIDENKEPTKNNLEPETIDLGAGLKVKLRQKEYCVAILNTYRELNPEIKLKLLCPQLLEIYSHYSIHLLSTRDAKSEEIQLIIAEINDNISYKFPHLLGMFYQDIIAGFDKWGYVNKQPNFIAETTLEILSILEEKTNDENSASCYSAASNVIARTIREFGAKKDILERFKNKFKKIESNELLSTHFVGICVSLMYRFLNKSDFEYAMRLNKKAHFLTNKFPTKDNILNLTYGTTQLLRYQGKLISKQQKNHLWSSCIKISKKYAKLNPDIVQKILNELVSEINHLVKANDPYVPKKLNQLKDFIGHFKHFRFDSLLIVGGFLQQYFEYYLENNDIVNLKISVDLIEEYNKVDSLDLNYLWSPFHQNFNTKFQMQRKESKPLTIYKEIATYWISKKINNQMDWTMNQIIDQE